MNREQRTPWLTLCSITLPSPKYFDGSEEGREPWASWRLHLCHFCRHAVWSGSCFESDFKCHCGIYTIEDNACGDASDCWAFRPGYIYEDCVDTVGLALQGLFVDWNTLREIPRKHPSCPALKQEAK